MDDLNDVMTEAEDVEIPDDETEHNGVSLDADAILDTLVPGSIDWRDTVRRHPLGAVGLVGLVGYLVGRTKGSVIMAGITFFLIGSMRARWSPVKWWKAGTETLVIGLVSASVAYLVGDFLTHVI